MSDPIQPVTPPVGDGCPTAFSRADALRVAEATRYVERMYRNTLPPPRRPRPGDGGFLAITTTSVSAATTATAPGSGSAKFAVFASGAISASSEAAFTVYNYHDKTVASGATVWIDSAAGALWVTDVWSCTSLS